MTNGVTFNYAVALFYPSPGVTRAEIDITYLPPIPTGIPYDIFGTLGARSSIDGSITYNTYLLFSAGSYTTLIKKRFSDTDEIYFTYAYHNMALPPTTSTTTLYITGSTDNNPSWWAEGRTTVHMSATQSLYYGQFIQTGSVSGLDTPVFPFQLAQGDLIRFYDNVIKDFSETSEFRVVSVDDGLQASGSNGILYKYFTLDRPLNVTNIDNSTFPSAISKYIVLKHIPDETNVIANFNFPTINTQQSFLINVGSQTYQNQNNAASSIGNQFGLLIPQYLSQSVADNSGNIVKALRAQNLIQ